MATYRIDLHDLNNGTPRVSDLQVKKFSFSTRLNGAGTFEATMFGKHAQATKANLKPGATEVKVYRDATQVWGGYLWAVQVNKVNPKAFDIQLRGEGWYSRLRRRFVVTDLHYRDVNQHQIAWNLINHTQGLTDGSLGFTQGSNAGPNVQRERHYCAWERPNVASGIDELAQLDDGFDFELTPDKVFKTYSPEKRTATGLTIDGNDAMTFDYLYDAADMANYVTALGSDDCNPVVFDAIDTAQRSEFGLLMAVVDHDTNKEKDVNAHGRQYLRRRKRLRYRIGKVSWLEGVHTGPAWGAFSIGDTLTMTAASGFATFNRDFRIFEIEVRGEPPHFVSITLALDTNYDP